ncbi:hypothetical protein [Paraburkholderia guartelaensis]|uniref:hypothetical protein n=1 Tax=Paraburkholderia guartelaensis TaxID=2546446 RepID=UPI002AB6EC02|nr:hypothetical protein [Paraburkholderia guartelaensis]
MSAPKTGAFTRIAAARRATFISYREAIEKLAAFTGDTLNEVAANLKAEGLYAHSSAQLVGIERSVRYSSSSLDIVTLLDVTIRDGAIRQAWPEGVLSDVPSDPDEDGWIRKTFIEALRAANLPCPDTLGEPPPYDARSTPSPEWVKPFIGRRNIPLADAAQIIAGLSPPVTYTLSPEVAAKVSEWDSSLCDAIRASEIDLADGEVDEELADDTLLVHASIRSWCERWGHAWPVPDVKPQPVGDAELRKRLDEADAEIEMLRTERDALKTAASQAAGPPAPVPQDERIERTDLHVIGCLVRLLVGAGAPYGSQSVLIDAMLEKFSGVAGISARTLQKRFAKANESLEQI